MSSVSDGINWLWRERQKRRGCPSLQINSARLKAIIREKGDGWWGGGGALQEDKCWWDGYQQRRRGNGRHLTSRSGLKKHIAQYCVDWRLNLPARELQVTVVVGN